MSRATQLRERLRREADDVIAGREMFEKSHWKSKKPLRKIELDPRDALTLVEDHALSVAEGRARALRAARDDVLRGDPVGNASYSARQVADYLEARARIEDRAATAEVRDG